jgi:hypothetical protein
MALAPIRAQRQHVPSTLHAVHQPAITADERIAVMHHSAVVPNQDQFVEQRPAHHIKLRCVQQTHIAIAPRRPAPAPASLQ